MAQDRSGRDGRLLNAGLITTFLAAVGAAGAQPARLPKQSALGLAMLGLASHRIGRMVAFERVAEPLRGPFTATVPDDSGADETVVARGRGARWAIGELMSCPTCVATWGAMVLYLGLTFVPGPTRVLVHVLATAGVAELAHVGVEHLEWSGRAARRAAATEG